MWVVVRSHSYYSVFITLCFSQDFQVNVLNVWVFFLKLFLQPVDLLSQAVDDVFSVLEHEGLHLALGLDLLHLDKHDVEVPLGQVVLGQCPPVNVHLGLVPDHPVAHVDPFDVVDLSDHHITWRKKKAERMTEF